MADFAADRILVFIPAYRCAPQIGRVLRQFAAVPAGVFAEILVLDNRSPDDTLAAAVAASAGLACCPVTVARNRENLGLGGSHKAAFRHAAVHGFTHVAVLHGDDQARIDDLLALLAAGQHRRHAACLGARFARGSRRLGYARVRLVGNRVFNLLFGLATGCRIQDLGSGLNIVGRQVFTADWVARAADDLRFNVYLLLEMIDRRMSFMFFPISWREEDQASNVRLWPQARRTLVTLAAYVFDRPRFRQADHRDRPVDAYLFDVVHTTAGPRAATR